MNIDRRRFLGLASTAAAAAGATAAGASRVQAREMKPPEDPWGCLVDISRCIGCRKCELACNEVNGLPEPDESFDDLTVLNQNRRPDERSYTVVNRYFTGRLNDRNEPVPTFVKVQCMHCQVPACASACITGALQKQDNGAVTYDVSRCIGCRYCMVACPFQIPAYEYHNPITPRVQKCTFCFSRVAEQGKWPGCAAICPVEAITFGKRSDLLDQAHQRIDDDPLNYVHRVYGENEVGGTSWLYISKVPFEKLDSYNLPTQYMPKLTETIQHGLFAYLWAPITLFGLLTGAMWIFNRHQIAKGGEPTHDGRHDTSNKEDDRS